MLGAEFEFWPLSKFRVSESKILPPFLKSLLLLEFSTNFHETWHKCSTSQEEKNVGSGILNFGFCQNLGGPKAKFCSLF